MTDLTSIPEAKEAIYELLDAELSNDPATEDVPVIWGISNKDESVCIWTGDTELDFATLGHAVPQLDDNFKVNLVVEVLKASGRDQRKVETRMWEIANVVGRILRESTLIGHRCLFSKPSKVKQEFFQVDKRQGSRAFITLAGTARI